MDKIFSLIKNKAFQTVAILTIYLFTAKYIPVEFQRGFYTASLLIKDILLLVMPLAICIFIANTIRSFERNAPIFVLTIFLFETCSNSLCVWYGYFGGSAISDSIASFGSLDLQNNFTALWRLPLTRPAWWSSDKGAFMGLIIGSVAAFYYHNKSLDTVLSGANRIVEWLLASFFSRLIPIFILGFVTSMYQTNLLKEVVGNYNLLILWLLLLLTLYIAFIFLCGAGFVPSKFIQNVKNLAPAGAIALTSGCSLSTMPWTIKGASKNLENPDLAKAIIPATTNIQQVGDCIVNSFLCFVLYKQFYGYAPDLLLWAKFSVIFVLARFATAAILGGAMFVMLPIYESYLNFTGEMIAVIVALNVVLDPIVTSCNVLGVGSLCKVFEIVWKKVQKLFSAKIIFKQESQDVL